MLVCVLYPEVFNCKGGTGRKSSQEGMLWRWWLLLTSSLSMYRVPWMLGLLGPNSQRGRNYCSHLVKKKELVFNHWLNSPQLWPSLEPPFVSGMDTPNIPVATLSNLRINIYSLKERSAVFCVFECILSSRQNGKRTEPLFLPHCRKSIFSSIRI